MSSKRTVTKQRRRQTGVVRSSGLDATHYLLRVRLRRELVDSFDQYPFSLPAVRSLDELEFHPSVTFLVGENGTGKSTLLEAVAVAAGLNPEGGSHNLAFATCSTHSSLGQALRLVAGVRRPRDRYFLRAESFYNVASEIERLDQEPAMSPPIIASYGGRSLHQQSHGESFFALFMHRFGGGGLYFLDEPEAALSPMRQLALLAVLHDLCGAGSQFVIATHSPILMAYPESWIYELRDGRLVLTDWQQTEHVAVSRRFLGDPATGLRILLGEDGTNDDG